MHVHTARTTADKIERVAATLLPPEGDHDDFIDLKVVSTGGRDVVLVAIHADHDGDEPLPRAGETELRVDGVGRSAQVDPIHVEVYGPDHRYFEAEGGAAMPPDAAGLVEDVRRTWALWFGQDGRPTSLWLYRDATGAVIGEPIRLTTAGLPLEQGVGPAARSVTIRRKDNGWDRFAFTDDDGHLVGEFTVDPQHVTVVHDRSIQPGWAWPTD